MWSFSLHCLCASQVPFDAVPSSIYSCSLSHILEHEFFCLGCLGSSHWSNSTIIPYKSWRPLDKSRSWEMTKKFIFFALKKLKKHPQKLPRKTQIHFFSLLPAQPKQPKQKNSCSKMWPIDQLYIDTQLRHKSKKSKNLGRCGR